MFKVLGRFTAGHPWLICALWLAGAAGVGLTAPNWDRRATDDDIRFLPARCACVRGYQLLEQAFPQDVFASRIIFALERTDRPLSDADLAIADDLAVELNRLRQDAPELQIKRIHSHRDPFIGKRLVSNDGRCTLLQVSLGTPYLALQTRTSVDRAEQVVRQRLAGISDPPAVYTTGPAGVGRDLIRASGDSLEHTTLATVLLVVVILLLVYRSPLLALVPLITIATAAYVAVKVLALCTLIPGFVLVNISQVFAVVMLYGAGTDYCLFLISRYREELALGCPRTRAGRAEALVRSLDGVGGALAASAGTVICGLGLMGLAEFTKVRCGGPAIAIGLAVALLASLTLTPALLQILGRIAFRPLGGVGRRLATGPLLPAQENGLWDRISRQVVKRPLVIWLAAAAFLVPLALIGLRVQASYRTTSELAPTSSSVQGLGVIQRHFTAGEVGPITVLIESQTDWDTPQGRQVIAHLSQGFALLPNVAEVRSLTQPLGTPVPTAGEALPEPTPAPPLPSCPQVHPLVRNNLFQAVWRGVMQGFNDQVNRAARAVYLVSVPPGENGPAHHVTRLDVVLNTDPFDPRSLPTLETIQEWLHDELPRDLRGVQVTRAETYGVTVIARDMAEVTEGDRTRINILVLVGVFLILLVLVRQISLAGYLLATVLLSYYATLGATTLMAHWCNGRPLGEVDWRVPFFLFTILVAVGEDYNILLISRALQERKKHGGREGIRQALAHTGGTITSCGLIMAGTFATLMLAGLHTLIQIGFALAFGVLLDTFVVRPFLVPAFTLWLWHEEPEPKEEGLLPLKRSLPFRRVG
jgi:RND superfamily putative drug exporter